MNHNFTRLDTADPKKKKQPVLVVDRRLFEAPGRDPSVRLLEVGESGAVSLEFLALGTTTLSSRGGDAIFFRL